MDPHCLDVENLNFGIDECEEFNPFEYEENLTPTSNPQSVPSSNSEHVGKKPRVSKHTSLVWNHFTIINKENSKGEVENVTPHSRSDPISGSESSPGCDTILLGLSLICSFSEMNLYLWLYKHNFCNNKKFLHLQYNYHRSGVPPNLYTYIKSYLLIQTLILIHV